jgi:MFS family permease
MVMLGALTGALADRVDRRVLLCCGIAVMCLGTLLLAALALGGHLALWQVAAGAFVNGSVWTMEHTVRRALIGDVVSGDGLATAISLDSASFNGTRMVGPLAGGALYAALGLPGTYCVGAAVYLLALICVLGVRNPSTRGEAPARQGFGADLLQGWRHVRGNAGLRMVMWVTVVANLFGFSYVSMVPVIGERLLALDPRGIGVLMSMEGLGAMVGALTLSVRARPGRYWRIFLTGVALFLVMIAALSQSASVILSMLALFLAGLGIACFGVMQTTILLASSDAAVRSRVMGVLAVCIGTAPLGTLLVGVVAEALGPATALLLSSMGGLAMLAVLVARSPHLLRT